MIDAILLITTTVMHVLAADERIDLVDFARVVRYSTDPLEVHEIDRGPDGWPAFKDEDGEYMIGVEWDEPRDIAEVNIEFRHAISNRDEIKVQYFRKNWPIIGTGGWALLDDPFHGKWVTAEARWWAGDRDITFAFVPLNEEQPDEEMPPLKYRRTYRLRFLLGQRERPPVRYIHAYGPNELTEATFDIRLDQQSSIKAPIYASIVNGLICGEDTTTQSARLDNEPFSIRVYYAGGDMETPTRTIITLRNTHDARQGFSFLPAEAAEYGIIRIPSLGVTVTHRGSKEDLQAGYQPGMTVFDRVSSEPEQTFERARREIPELKKTQQGPRPFYMPLGPPEARQEIAVNYDGSIYLDRSALKTRAEDMERLKWPANAWFVSLSTGEPPFDHAAEGNIKQRLLEGYLPILINSWSQGGIEYEQTCVSTFLEPQASQVRGDETVVLLCRLKMVNTADQPAKSVVRLAVDPPEWLTFDHGHVRAEALCKRKDDKKEERRYDSPRYRFYLKAPDNDVTVVGRSELEPAKEGLNGTTLTCQRRLEAGQTYTIEWYVPFVTLDKVDELDRMAGLNFDRVLPQEADRWQKIIDQAATIEVPDALLNDFYKAQLAHILITADRDPYTQMRVLPAATYGYNVCMNESCHQIRALEIRGLHDEAERFLNAFIEGQSTRGLHGRFTDKKGVLHGLPTKNGDYQTFNYNLDHGFALWMLNEHYRFTRDRKWLDKAADALIEACDFVTRQRNTPIEANTLGKDDSLWGAGLLSPGHLEDPPEWLWWFAVNAYAYRGMQATAESLTEIKHPQADRIAAEAGAFGDHLRESCRESMIRAPVVRLNDGTYVPYQPTRSRLRGRDLGWIRDALYGPIHLIDCGIYDHDSAQAEWILRDTEDNVFIGPARGRRLDDFERQWFSWGGITLQSNLLPNPLVYLRRGQPKHAVRAFYNSLAANVYADVRTFCEHPIRAYGFGQGPFFKSPDESAFIVWFRHLLIAESGQDLDLLAAVPASWLAPGKQIKIERAATWFGPINLCIESKQTPQQIELQLAGPRRNPPRAIRLHIRRPEAIRSVTVDGQPVSTVDMDKGIITLPGDIGQTMIIVSY